MRALAPLPAFLLLAASAAACPFGFPGHVHPSPAQVGESSAPLPAGRCAGTLPALVPPKSDEPLDLTKHPEILAERAAWETIGFRFDDGVHRLLWPDAGLVTVKGLEFLRSPWDASREKLEVPIWNSLVMGGYRLDEATCRMNGGDSQPASQLNVLYAKAEVKKGLTQIALERLLATLRALPPGAPLPDSVRLMSRQLEGAGTPLPPDLLALINRPNTTVAQLLAPATATYQGLASYFDGQMSAADTLALVLPSAGGAASRRSPYRDATEREFGRALQNALSAELARNPVGAELLARFARDKRNGTPNLLVLKLSQDPADMKQYAFYSPDKDTLVINHWTVADVVRLRTSPGERAALEPLLSDPAKLMAHVTKRPELMRAVIEELDLEYFHELLHADQSRRTTLDDENIRGNTPLANPLDKEREAHREHCRYLMAKSSYDPDAVHESRWRDYCLGMLRDPDAFQDMVTQNYLATQVGSATAAELPQMQEVRRAAASAPAQGWLETGRRLLRRVGLSYGDAALADFNADMSRRAAAFNAGIAEFRARTAAEMAASRMEPELALQYRAVDPAWIDAPDTKALVETATAWIVKNKPTSANLGDRLAVIDRINQWMQAHASSSTPDYFDAANRDFAAAAELQLKAAKDAKTPHEREVLLANAQAYADAARDRALLARIKKLRNAK